MAVFPRSGPSDFFLFPDLKSSLGRKRVSPNKEVTANVNAYFAERRQLLFGKVKEVRASLENVHGLERRLH